MFVPNSVSLITHNVFSTCGQVQDLPEAREFQLERLLSIISSLVAASKADVGAANSMGSTELFMQVQP